MNKLLLTLSAFCLAFSFTASATHVAGGDIRYQCVGQDSFLFSLNFYRDCDGTTPPPDLDLEFRCTEDPNGTVYTLEVPIVFQNEIGQICDDPTFQAQSSCNFPGNVGLESMQWYQGQIIVDLSQYAPIHCSDWVFSYDIQARNTSINGVGQPQYYVETLLNNGGVRDCNDSPYFTAQPIPYVCAGQQVNYSFGVAEQNGDSLVYSIDTAYSSFGNIIPYETTPLYTPQAPFGMANPVTIDQQTGQLTFVAPALTGAEDNYIVVVKVREYDPNTGVLVGTVTRDIQLVVIDCLGNTPPQSVPGGIQNFSGTGAQVDSNTVIACYGQSFDFELEFIDYDTNGNISTDSLFVSSNIAQILPGATFTATPGNPATINVTWTAQPVNAGFATFNFFVEDNACPFFGIATFTYDIIIVPSTVLPADTAICSEDSIQLDAQGGNSFTWTVIDNPIEYGGGPSEPIAVGLNFSCDSCGKPIISPNQTSTYVVVSDLDVACGNTDTITIEVFDEFPINIGTNSPYCVDQLLDTLTAETPGGSWFGPGIANVQEGIFVPGAVDPGFGKDTIVEIIYSVSGTCPNVDTMGVVVSGFPDARILTQGPLCELTASQQLEGYTSGGTWSGPNVSNTGVITPTSFNAPDTVRVFHTVDENGCVFTDSLDFRIISQYNSEIDSLPKICEGEELNIYLNEYEGDPFGVWSGNRVNQDPPESGEFFFSTADLSPGAYTITYTIEGECGTSSNKELIISALPDASIFGADSVYCDNIVDSIQLETATTRGIWGGDMNELHDGYFVPSRVGEGFYSISYELYDTVSTCYNKEIVNVRIARTPPRPKVFGGGPYCQGHNLDDLRGDGLLTNTFKWFQVRGEGDSTLLGAGNPFRYGELQDMPTILYGTQVSEYGCESPTSRLEIEVLPSPIAEFSYDTLEGTVPLEVNFTNLSGPDSMNLAYAWNVDGNTVSTSEDFTYEFLDIGRYLVELVADNGPCDNNVFVTVVVDRLTDFFAPNVFTPNKDGFNDFFTWEVEGIEEFRFTVYNRWGGKVFETEDIDDFWDGGNEPSGVYFYVMTGTEKTLDSEPVEWRGDVTLLRE